MFSSRDRPNGWLGRSRRSNVRIFVIDKKNYLGPREEVMSFAHNLARAIACYDGKALKKVVAFLHEVDWECYRRNFEETKVALGRQIDENFSRIIVRGLLVNKGKTSYAVAGAAKMRLCGEGTKLHPSTNTS